MLDQDGPFSLDAAPGLRLYPDDAEPTTFYALPERPRIARTVDGGPEISLVLYGKRDASGFVPRGGILMLTTTLDLTEAERAAAVGALTRRLATDVPDDHPPAATLGVPDVTGVEVSVSLVAGVRLASTQTAGPGGRCAFSIKLDAEQARALQEAWADGLPDAAATYRLTLRAGPGRSSVVVAHGVETYAIDSDLRSRGWSQVEASEAPPRTGAIEVAGPLEFPDLGSRTITRTEL